MNELYFRKAGIEDLDLTFEWANDEAVRMASFYPEPINHDVHRNWFKSRLEDPNSLLLIFLVNDQPIGLVRFQSADENAIIGISIAANYRGKGYATTMLTLACSHYHFLNQLPIFAYIKKDNTSSVKSFEKAKFDYLKEDLVNGFSCYVYILSKNEN